MNAKKILGRSALAGAVAASAVALAVPAASAGNDESADVGVTIAADKAAYKVGELVTYTVTVTNHGQADASGVKVTDVLPDGLELVSATESPVADGDGASTSVLTDADGHTDPAGLDAGPFAGRTKLEYGVGDLASGYYSPSGSSTTITIVARATKAGTISNEVSVGADNPDPNVGANNYALSTVAVS